MFLISEDALKISIKKIIIKSQKTSCTSVDWFLKNPTNGCWKYIYIYIHTYIIYILTYLILHSIDSTRCWKHSSEVLLHIDMIALRSCYRFVCCTCMMQISRSTTSQRCSIGLRSGDCGGPLSNVNSLSCSWNQSEMIWALWRGALSCWK